jgi:hypothetical protein
VDRGHVQDLAGSGGELAEQPGQHFALPDS